MLTRGAGLITTMLVVVLLGACERRDAADSLMVTQAPLDFRLGVSPGRACEDCTSFAFEGILGQRETILARREPDLTLGSEQLSGVTAWKAPDGFHITVIANEQGVESLSGLAEKGSNGEIILVSVGEYSLGTISPSLLKASHGILGFSFTQEERFSLLLDELGVAAKAVTESTDGQLLKACSEIAGSDAVSLERCRRLTWSDIARQKESLRNAEKLLESARPEDRDAAIESLLKD